MQEGTSLVWRKAGKAGEGSNPDNSQHTRLLAYTVVNVATIEFRFRAIVLIEKFVLDVAYEKIGVAGSQSF